MAEQKFLWGWNPFKWLWGFFSRPEPEQPEIPELEEIEPIEVISDNGGNNMKKALITGINKYPTAPLRGCVNDALLMYKVLSERYGFKKENIDLMTDQECTKDNMLKHLRMLVKDAKPGDTIFFHYSGHGSQVVVNDWTNNEESDGRDEILCPIDLDWNDPLRDHHLGNLFRTMPKGVKIVVVLDCCNSGTGLRDTGCRPIGQKDENDWVNRFLAPPPSNILMDKRISLDDELNFVIPNEVPKRGFLVDTVEQGEAILITGSQDNQTSADAYINGKYRGALTFLLVQTLQESNWKISYKDLVTKVNQKMDRFNFTQNPQLEAKKEYFDNNFLA